MIHSISYSCVCHIGNRREMVLFGVFDGLGGEMYGEKAAFMAAKEAAVIEADPSSEQLLREYCIRANKQICTFAEEISGSFTDGKRLKIKNW